MFLICNQQCKSTDGIHIWHEWNWWCFCCLRAVPIVLKFCSELIEMYGVVDGIYRLSGISSNIQRLRFVVWCIFLTLKSSYCQMRMLHYSDQCDSKLQLHEVVLELLLSISVLLCIVIVVFLHPYLCILVLLSVFFCLTLLADLSFCKQNYF